MSTPATLISDIDATLSMLRKSWLESQSREETRRWWDLINKALDERLALMALRPKSQIPT